MNTKPSLHVQQVVLYLFSLESSFLLYKVLASKNQLGVNDPGLLKVSLRMFETVVRLWERRAYYENFLPPLSWLVGRSSLEFVELARLTAFPYLHSSPCTPSPPPAFFLPAFCNGTMGRAIPRHWRTRHIPSTTISRTSVSFSKP